MARCAVHLEIAGSLNASSFSQAFFRFMHRRGSVKEMYSGRGTNFVLAERELRNGIMRWNQQNIHDTLCQNGVQWRFYPPLSPSSGGAWEVLVKAVKKILRFLLRDRSLDEESLHTFMVEVESILNNRLLTPVSDSPDISRYSPLWHCSQFVLPHHYHLMHSLRLMGIAVPGELSNFWRTVFGNDGTRNSFLLWRIARNG